MAQRITAAAAAIAAHLETLPAIGRAYPYPRPMSLMEFGDLAMGISGTSPPETFQSGGGGFQGFQTVIWQVAVKLGDVATTGPAVEDVQRQIADLASADPATSIIGLLRAPTSRQVLAEHGGPIVTEDGVEVSYAEDVGDTVITIVECQITANVRV